MENYDNPSCPYAFTIRKSTESTALRPRLEQFHSSLLETDLATPVSRGREPHAQPTQRRRYDMQIFPEDRVAHGEERRKKKKKESEQFAMRGTRDCGIHPDRQTTKTMGFFQVHFQVSSRWRTGLESNITAAFSLMQVARKGRAGQA